MDNFNCRLKAVTLSDFGGMLNDVQTCLQGENNRLPKWLE